MQRITIAAAMSALAFVVAYPAGARATVSGPSGSTAVKLRWFTARREGARSVTLRWRTTTELNLLGFNVYRRVAGEERSRLIERVLPAQNDPAGATYTYLDRLPRNASARYRLQAVNGNGSKAWIASALAR